MRPAAQYFRTKGPIGFVPSSLFSDAYSDMIPSLVGWLEDTSTQGTPERVWTKVRSLAGIPVKWRMQSRRRRDYPQEGPVEG